MLIHPEPVRYIRGEFVNINSSTTVCKSGWNVVNGGVVAEEFEWCSKTV
jgi:hypothetical protein